MKAWNGPAKYRLVFLLMLVGIPLFGSFVRSQRAAGCTFDGSHIDQLLKVRIVDARGSSLDFCCIQCAVWWLERQTDRSLPVLVTDEASAALVPAGLAHFVRSSVVNQKSTGNRIHAFKQLGDAKRHAEVARGTILTGLDRPFRSSVEGAEKVSDKDY